MDSPKVEIKLLRAPDDPAEYDPAFQHEFRSFTAALRAGEVAYSQRGMAFDSAAGSGYPLAEFIISQLGPAAIGAIAVAAREWLKGRAARKVQVKIGDIKVQAATVTEVLQVLDKAAALQGETTKTKKRQ